MGKKIKNQNCLNFCSCLQACWHAHAGTCLCFAYMSYLHIFIQVDLTGFCPSPFSGALPSLSLSCAFLHRFPSTLLATTEVRGSWVTDCSTFPTILVVEGDPGTGWSGMRIGEFLGSVGLKQKRELRVSGVARHHRGVVVEVMTNRWVQSTAWKRAGEEAPGCMISLKYASWAISLSFFIAFLILSMLIT